jgi:hypothetical protein
MKMPAGDIPPANHTVSFLVDETHARSVMRKYLVILPVATILLACGVLVSGLSRSFAAVELPATPPVIAPAPAAIAETADDWTETAKKIKPNKSSFQPPKEPYPPGSRRRR